MAVLRTEQAPAMGPDELRRLGQERYHLPRPRMDGCGAEHLVRLDSLED